MALSSQGDLPEAAHQPVIGGHPLEVQWHGPSPAEAPTLVFLHEGLGSASLWRDFPRRLAEATGCGALVYSRAGYGQSGPVPLPRPTRYMHHEGLEVLPELLEQFGVREHLLIGHSDGGSIALINAGGAPRPGLLGVITEAAHVFNEDLSVASIAEAKEAYEHTDLRARLARHHRDVDNAFRGWNDVWLSPDFERWNIEEYLPGITVPLLVIQGEEDQYGTSAQVQAIVQRTGGPAEALMLPDCAHTPHREQPERTFEAMRAFVGRLTAGRTEGLSQP
ncbi:alpha/beta hydrolase (plasmid) [Deinococcus metallilatus]|uniref:Alpha/beta hydrolase n=1 Tax=Deinococcus metallilatus TaxID=1211322 RepID=A0AAJ5F5R3_9DEIO|nr:alpha/beta hydrolase [Deinococcus metallilatus]MBB5293363.1 pimeloyl-ACP methyl ester carboxylesterase [Deinococcus metallilatus]QBY06469.1 alpha/beta hydrolase [Deinococcus metallilatus]RXJ17812.1 alpha/beta hydrolase [Deinococcus metallilatus]TLK32084.1 alpha/beta hydrolase [Deinococcus metallilatus]GMA15414.1 hydrolase [Deinococcus metallilatus]